MKPAPMADHTPANQSSGWKPKLSWIGHLLLICLLLLLVIIGAALVLLLLIVWLSPWLLPWLLLQQDIEFDWQSPQWRYDGFSVSTLQLNLPADDGKTRSLELDNLQIDWAWQAYPVQRLEVSRLKVHWPLPEDTEQEQEQEQQQEQNETALGVPDALRQWLPRQLILTAIDANLRGLGHLQGSLTLQSGDEGKLWQPHYIQTQLSLEAIQGDWLDAIPKEFQPTQLTVHITTHPDHHVTSDQEARDKESSDQEASDEETSDKKTSNGRQLLKLNIHSEGPMPLRLNGTLDLQQKPTWQGALKDAQLFVQLESLTHPSFNAKQLRLSATFDAQADAEGFTFNFNQGSKLEISTLHLTDIGSAQKITVDYSTLKLVAQTSAGQQVERFTVTFNQNAKLEANTLQLTDSASTKNIASAEKIIVQLAGFELERVKLEAGSTSPYATEVASPISAQIKNLDIAQLHKQNWDFKGTLKGQLLQLELSGDLTGQQGLGLNTSIRLLPDSVQGSATLNPIFFKAGNPLQKTLKAWPPLLSLNSGRLSGQIDFNLPSDDPVSIKLQGNASGLSGIFDRSELSNLSLAFSSQLLGPNLTVAIPDLSIEQLDPGIPIEQLQLKGARYQASLSHPLTGVAEWQGLEAKLLNGKVWLNAQQYDLQGSQELTLQVQGLELQELLEVYPAEGLDGTATIDGLLPIRLDNNTFSIDAGHLKAREPGVLQFRSAKIKALGQSNPAMQLVADALDNFHFSLLSSALSYDPSGKLLLEVALQGQNPNVQKGRPINLNVNLEEDIPALLASIQLSGQVSEMIQKRVRERFKKP